MKKPINHLCTLAFLISSAHAHLAPGSLVPSGGQTFKRGDVMAIKWVVEQEHSGGYDIAYSPAPGTWISILTGIRNDGARFDQPMDTSWKVPDTLALTATARIRIWQRSNENGNGQAGETSNLYTLVSGNLTIQAGTPARLGSPQRRGALRWNWQAGTLTVRAGGESGGGMLMVYRDNGRLESSWSGRSGTDGALRFAVPANLVTRGRLLCLQLPAGKARALHSQPDQSR